MTAPTDEECSANALVHTTHAQGYAVHVPQIGGYGAKGVVTFDTGNDCFDLYVWHDGEFPIPDDGEPVELHGCDPEQLVRFAATLVALKARS